MFEAIKKVTLTEQIMDRIADMIVRGELPAGTKLPNERLLAEQFGVARGRIREALRALSLIGLITIKAGDGSYVTHREQPLPAGTIAWLFREEIGNLAEVYDARQLIESAVYLSAARHMAQEQFEQLEGRLAELIAHMGSGSPDPFLYNELLDDFDLYVGDMCGNRIYARLMQTIIHLRRETCLKLLQVPGAMEHSMEARSQIVHAIKSGDIDRVRKAVNQFFSGSKSFYQRLVRDRDD